MLFLIFYILALILVAATGFAAAWSDFRCMKISNIYAVAVLGLFPVAYAAAYFGGADIFMPFASHALSAAGVFVVTFLMFLARVFGGGDSKLASAFALWFGLPNLPIYLFCVAIVGSVVGVAALAIKKFKPFKAPVAGSWIARLQTGEEKGVPYGVAIVLGAVWAFIALKYVSVDHLGDFFEVRS